MSGDLLLSKGRRGGRGRGVSLWARGGEHCVSGLERANPLEGLGELAKRPGVNRAPTDGAGDRALGDAAQPREVGLGEAPPSQLEGESLLVYVNLVFDSNAVLFNSLVAARSRLRCSWIGVLQMTKPVKGSQPPRMDGILTARR